MINFNSAPEQKERGEASIIPPNSFCKLKLYVNAPKEGKVSTLDPNLSVSDKGNSYISFNAACVQGPFKGKELNYLMYTVDGSEKAVNIGMAFLRGALESARSIMPTDNSPKAVKARQVTAWTDFDGLVIVAKIGIKKAQAGDKWINNEIKKAVTPDMEEYAIVMAGTDIISDEPIPVLPGGQAQETQSSTTPPWAAPHEGSEEPPHPAESNSPVPAWAR